MERGPLRCGGQVEGSMMRGDNGEEGILRHGCGHEAMPVPVGTACTT
jgi:hypothetical protein